VPVLARNIESQGIPTVTVTMLPDIAEKYRLSRVVGVPVPFGHSFGTPGNDEFQLAASRLALRALSEAGEPGYRLDLDMAYPVPDEIAYKTWHPPVPSPAVAQMLKARAAAQETTS
jgi:hypothetical protein